MHMQLVPGGAGIFPSNSTGRAPGSALAHAAAAAAARQVALLQQQQLQQQQLQQQQQQQQQLRNHHHHHQQQQQQGQRISQQFTEGQLQWKDVSQGLPQPSTSADLLLGKSDGHVGVGSGTAAAVARAGNSDLWARTSPRQLTPHPFANDAQVSSPALNAGHESQCAPLQIPTNPPSMSVAGAMGRSTVTTASALAADRPTGVTN